MNTSVQKYNRQDVGMNGFWDWVKRGVAAVANVMGFPMGTALGILADGVENIVGGQSFGQAFGGAFTSAIIDFTGGPQGRGITTKTPDDYKQDVIDNVEQWHDNIFIPWAKNYLKKLSPEQNSDFNSPAFREKLNEVIRNFEALRLYYKMQAETRAQGRRGLQLDVVLDESDLKSKASIFQAYKVAIQTAYENYLTSEGKPTLTETVSFSAHNHNINGPESINWNGSQATSELVVFKGSKGTVNVDFPNTVGGTRDPKTPKPISSQIETGTFKPTTTTTTASIIPGVSNKTLYWIGGGIAGSWLLYKAYQTTKN